MKPRTVIIAAAACFVVVVPARSDYTREFDPFPVVVDGDALDVPFWGGLNNPKPSLVDFNGDSLVDLMLGGPGGRLAYFRNEGTAFAPDWKPVVERLAGLDIGTWHVLVDIDTDSDLDLFCDNRMGGALFYRNDGGSEENTVFTLVDTAYAGFELGFNNTPTFADIDSDGDYDFFYGAASGALEFHENTGTPAAASFALTETFYDSILAFPGGGKAAAEPNHGFSNIQFADIDADHDPDLFWGDIFNPNLYLFENLGDSTESDLTWSTEFYLTENTRGFNHPRFFDLDADYDLDMVLGVANAAVIDNLQLLINYGDSSQAFFVPEDLNLIKNLDVGSFSQPAFGDLDNDNDMDMLVGAGDGTVWYFRNTGSRFAPEFTLTDLAAGIDVGLNAAPALVDWDGDGDLDLLVGTQQGMVEYWRNEGSPTSFEPVLNTSQLGGIKVDQYAVPRPADLNDDGLVDLVVGEWDFNSFANVRLYENTGSPAVPELTAVTETLVPRLARDYAVPAVFDWNGDGRPDIVLGGRNAGFTVYVNQSAAGTFPDSTTLVASTDTVPGWDNGTYLSAAFVDIDSDGDSDLFVGEENGGLSFYRREGSCCLGIRGNADGDPNDAINVADLTYIVTYLFKGGPQPPCALEANADGDAGESLNVADLTSLVGYLFKGGAPPPTCP